MKKSTKPRKPNPPKQKQSRLKDDGPEDYEDLVKHEFMRLHRQYRLMEDTRRVISEKAERVSIQGKLLHNLQAEKEDLETDIKNATCRLFQTKDQNTIHTILDCLERFERFKREIKECILNIGEMEENVDKITKRLTEQQLKIQALYGQALTVPCAEKRKSVLENRLYYVTTQFDTVVSKNKLLRIDINMVLKLRGQFFRRVVAIKKLSLGVKKSIAGIVYDASATYEQRDDWVAKINALRDRNDKDSKQHVLEIKEFNRILHHDSKVISFLAAKNKERELLENHSQHSQRKSKVKLEELEVMLKSYQISFKKILNMSKSKNIEDLITFYLEEEQKNYSNFKFITDINHEANNFFLRKNIANMKNELRRLSEESHETSKNEEETLAESEIKLQSEKDELNQLSDKWKVADTAMEEFGNALDEAYNTAECSNAPIMELLGNQMGMRPHNICLCMRVFEHRISDLTFEKWKLEIRKSVEIDHNPMPKKTQLWVPGAKPQPKGGPFKPTIVVTGRIDGENEEEDSDDKAMGTRPFYYEELRSNMLIKLKASHSVTEHQSTGSMMEIRSQMSIPQFATNSKSKPNNL